MMPATTPQKPRKTWLFYALVAAAIALTGCADESATWGASQLDLADAIAQAAKEGI